MKFSTLNNKMTVDEAQAVASAVLLAKEVTYQAKGYAFLLFFLVILTPCYSKSSSRSSFNI
jgi:hypothetical protein